MRAFRLACLAYLSVALPGSTLGVLWPSMRLSFHHPVGSLGILLAFGVTASVISSAATGRLLSRAPVGSAVAIGTMASALVLAIEALAPSLWVFAGGTVLFGLGFGAVDSALNAHAASHFSARDINWMHASYGLGATIGPLLVTALLSCGLSWRWAFGIMAVAQAALALLFALSRTAWHPHPHPCSVAASVNRPGELSSKPAGEPAPRQPSVSSALIALIFVAVETGIESGAGIWGFVYLTAGRGLPNMTAGVVVSAYWATMFAGRAVLGPVAEQAGPARVLGWAVAGVPLGAAVMAVPGPGLLAAVGMMIVGVAAAPVFPLFTLTTARRAGAAGPAATTRTVSLQVAASAAGSAAPPAGIGLAIGAFSARALAPSLLILGLAMCGVYALLSRATTTAAQAG